LPNWKPGILVWYWNSQLKRVVPQTFMLNWNHIHRPGS
jgi:hypothetical protein